MRLAGGRFLLIGLVVALQACASGRSTQQRSEIPSGWPVERSEVVVTFEFGVRPDGSRHEGFDLAASAGTPVWATADGTVVSAARDGRYGRSVLIDHGKGYRTRYAHLKKIETKTGKRIRRGDQIGRVGSSGNASGPHLHYEVLKYGVPVDPRLYLD